MMLPVVAVSVLSALAVLYAVAHHQGYQRAQRQARRTARSHANVETAAGSIPAPKPLPRSCRDHQEPVILYLKPLGRKTRHGRN